jgi:uncharacterized membrane protein YfcA
VILHETLLQYAGLISLGFAVSAYGTLIGAGGGFVLMPLLLLLYPHEDPHHLTAISLTVVFLNTLSGTAVYAKMKRIDYKAGLTFAAATIPGAIFGALTTASVSRELFEGVFSVFLIALALFMILRPKSDKSAKHANKDVPTHGRTRHAEISVDGMVFDYSYNRHLGLVLFFFLGFIASFLGIGGGSLIVPLLAYVLSFPVAIATATSQMIVAILTFISTMSHVFIGSFYGIHRVIALGVGMVTGAQVGARLSNKIKGPWIIRSLAIALVVVGVRMLITAF